MLKHKITAAEFEALSDDMKAHYAVQPDLSYNIDLGPSVFIDTEDPAKLKAALEAERAVSAAAKAAADRLEAAKIEADRSKLTTVEEVTASFQKQFDDLKKEQKLEKKQAAEAQQKAKLDVAQGQLQTKALEISSKLFGTNAPLMLPHVESQLMVVGEDNPTVGIKDLATGLQSLDQNFENFEKGLSTHPTYAPMVVVSNASGGRADDGKSTGLPASTTADGKTKGYGDYQPDELLKIKRENPERFKQLKSSQT